ncbi:restriction endonuclease subunit S [Bacteroides fluxus]|uniref:restriction endonuclease subunit S n=1 Tax=Bacteroides fluxus TaxID=626930 RepID=UPI0023F10319|nr:restriction endonuclease subunit S [Bacteroides fluxus]
MMEPEIRFKGFEGEWEPFSLKDVCEINPQSPLPETFEYVDLESVVGTSMVSHRTENRLTAPSRAQRLAKGGDIFYQTVRPYQKNNYLFVNQNTNFVFSTGYAQLRTKIDSKYLFNILQTDRFVNQVLLNCTGTSYPAINPTALSNLKIGITRNKTEQKQIASCFKSLDALIQSATKKIASLKQLKSASLVSMFPQAGETKPRVRFKGFKGDWENINLSEIFVERHEISTITESLPQLSFTIAEGVIRPEDRKSNKRDFLIKDIDTKKYLVTYRDDIIYNPANVIYGAIHKNSLCNGVVSPIYKIFYTDQNADFMECIVRKPSFIQEMTIFMEGTVKKLKTLKPESFLKMSAYISPSLEEQKKIGDFFHSLNIQITLETQRLDKLKQIKSACLDKMFV